MSPRQHLSYCAAHRVPDHDGRAYRQLVYEGGQVVRAALHGKRGSPATLPAMAAEVRGHGAEGTAKELE